MVKQREKNNRKKPTRKGFKKNRARARKISASTGFDTCTEQLSPFGGLLGLIKFLDLVDFAKIFDSAYIVPRRDPKLGHYSMVVGILMLLFIGFNRICHFAYVQLDAMLCGFFRLEKLPVVSTFWRYVDSMGINQGKSLLTVMSVLRERVWKQLGLYYGQINISIDTTVETLYGRQQGGRKGHNTKNRGKKGYRPVLGFIDQTREYIAGKLRAGETIIMIVFTSPWAGRNQLVMLAYNIWRYMKLPAVQSEAVSKSTEASASGMKGIGTNTLRIARLKMLLIAAKVVMDQNRTKVKYSIHDARTPLMIHFLTFLDEARNKPKAWLEDGGWQQNFAIA